jgi:hypothetical protein
MKNKMELQIGWLLALILLAVMGLSLNVPVHAYSLYIGDGVTIRYSVLMPKRDGLKPKLTQPKTEPLLSKIRK